MDLFFFDDLKKATWQKVATDTVADRPSVRIAVFVVQILDSGMLFSDVNRWIRPCPLPPQITTT